MGDGADCVQESSDMSISSDDDGMKKSNVELEENHDEAQPDVLLEDPELGMTFDTENDVREYYKNYAKAKGFGVTRRSSNTDDKGVLKYLTLCCSRYGKSQSNSRNMLKPNPTAGLGCKAKVNIVRGPEGKFHLSTVILDHNHTLSPHKSRLFRCNKKLDFHVKRRLELNDRAGIRINKSFNSFVVAADGHDNMTFGEKECRNFLEKTRRLKLGNGDAEAIRDYFMKMQSDNPNFFSLMDVDDESRLRNVFWADARSRAVYDSFGDVVTFDTTLYGETTNKSILSPIAVRCVGRPPSSRIESKVDKIRQAREKKKKAEQREKKKAAQKEKKKAEQEARSMNLKKKRSNAKMKSSQNDILQQEGMEHEIQQTVYLDGRASSSIIQQDSFDLGVRSSVINPTMTASTPYGTIQGPFNLGISTSNMNPTMPHAVPSGAVQDSFEFGIRNINPTMAAALPSGSSSAMVMPPILGKYTSMLLQVQQSSTALSNSPELHLNGIGRVNDTMDQS